MLFDHFLSVEWSRVAPGDRDEFIEGVYRVLCDHPALLPPPLARVARGWVAADWLRAYGSADGVDAVLHRLASRLTRPAPLLDAWARARDDLEPLRGGFLHVFPDVRAALDGLHPGTA